MMSTFHNSLTNPEEVNFCKRTKPNFKRGRLPLTKSGGSAQGLRPPVNATSGLVVTGECVETEVSKAKGFQSSGHGDCPDQRPDPPG